MCLSSSLALPGSLSYSLMNSMWAAHIIRHHKRLGMQASRSPDGETWHR